MLTKEHKEIIEIVKGEMNKELEEGAYFICHPNLIHGNQPFKFLGSDELNFSCKDSLGYILNGKKYDFEKAEIKILGTLDITCILKYIIKSHKYFTGEVDMREDYILIEGEAVADIKIPLKPYTTYTQEEKEALLELLKRI